MWGSKRNLMDENIIKPKGYWVSFTSPAKKSQLKDACVEVGSGHIYRIESVWLAFVMVSKTPTNFKMGGF